MTPPVAHRSHERRTAAWFAAFPLAGLLLAGCDRGTDPAPVPPQPIAFIAWDPTISSERIYLVADSGTNLRPLPLVAPRFTTLSDLSWAPDRHRLALSSGGAIYVFDTTSTSLTLVPTGAGYDTQTRETVSDGTPVWSPDGSRIAFTRRRTAFRTENANDPTRPAWTLQVCVANADGSGVTCLAGLPGRAGSPAWSPDGRRLAFAAGDATVPTAPSSVECPRVLYVANADGTSARAVTTLPAEIRCGTLYYGDTSPVWSPDSRRLAFVSDRERGSYQFGFGHIYVVNADGSNSQRLTQTPAGFATADDRAPSWSPDGRRIAYSHRAHTATGSIDPLAGLHVMNTDGSGSTRIVADMATVDAVAWRPSP